MMSMWQILCDSEEHPGKHAAIRWTIQRGVVEVTGESILADDLIEIRRELAGKGAQIRLPRCTGDPPSVVETWL